MITIQGLGGPPDPVATRPGQGRDRAQAGPKSDDVSFSEVAVQAASAGQAATRSRGVELRQERIEQAKESIERGTYRIQEVVLQVAERLARFVD